MSKLTALATLREEVTGLIAQVIVSTGRVRGVNASLESSFGSGWVVSPEGHFVTNYHVIEGMDARIAVDMSGTTLEGRLVGTDQTTDLAVLKLEGKLPPPLQFRAQPARLGEPCFAFGSPLDYHDSVSMGLISGLNRQVSTETASHEGMLQTDAAINPGNSGGPLVDVDGLVLGMNTAVRNNASNIGFAQPSSVIEWISSELIAHGSVLRASLGIRVAPARGLDASYGRRLMVTGLPNPCGDVRPGDILLSLGGHEIVDRFTLVHLMRRETIGKAHTLRVLRQGTATEVEITPRSAGT